MSTLTPGKLWVPLIDEQITDGAHPGEYGEALTWAAERAHFTGAHILTGPAQLILIPADEHFLVFPVSREVSD